MSSNPTALPSPAPLSAEKPLVGYCTNVHAGASLAQTRSQLATHSVAVRKRLGDAPLGIGLWLSAQSAAELLQSPVELAQFRDWLSGEGLVVYTINGFPYHDFHQPVVKHEVYRPVWGDPSRTEFTLNLAELLDALAPAGRPATISTLPLAWGGPSLSKEAKTLAAAELLRAADALAEREARTGRRIQICLEPEPGCELGTTTAMLGFFQQFLHPRDQSGHGRRHLAICHDVCHAAVMFEDQAWVLQSCRDAGVSIGKIQVSAAVQAIFPDDDAERAAVQQALHAFNEPRYLHQTSIHAPSGRDEFFEDLPGALAAHPAETAGAEWRVHFHVPIFLRKFGRLFATQDAILDCLKALPILPETPAIEVETYAWGVLPAELRTATLAEGIAAELQWLAGRMPR